MGVTESHSSQEPGQPPSNVRYFRVSEPLKSLKSTLVLAAAGTCGKTEYPGEVRPLDDVRLLFLD